MLVRQCLYAEMVLRSLLCHVCSMIDSSKWCTSRAGFDVRPFSKHWDSQNKGKMVS